MSPLFTFKQKDKTIFKGNISIIEWVIVVLAILFLTFLSYFIMTTAVIWLVKELFAVNWTDKFWAVFAFIILLGSFRRTK